PSLGAPSRSGMSSSLAEAQSPHQEGLSLQSLFGGLRELKWEHPGLVRAMDYMLTYHRHPLTVELVSSAVKLPEVQLNQLLKYRLGMSFEQMMSKIRVEQAKVLIQLEQDSRRAGQGVDSTIPQRTACGNWPACGLCQH